MKKFLSVSLLSTVFFFTLLNAHAVRLNCHPSTKTEDNYSVFAFIAGASSWECLTNRGLLVNVSTGGLGLGMGYSAKEHVRVWCPLISHRYLKSRINTGRRIYMAGPQVDASVWYGIDTGLFIGLLGFCTLGGTVSEGMEASVSVRAFVIEGPHE